MEASLTRSLLLLGMLVAPLIVVVGGCESAQSSLSAMRLARAESPQIEESGEDTPKIVFGDCYSEALSVSRQSGKPLLLFFTADGCAFCEEMLEETFHDDAVVRLSEDFVCVRVEVDAHPEICRQFHIEAFPTVQFVSPDGTPRQRVLGMEEAEAMAAQMQVALDGPQIRTAFSPGLLRR